MQVPGGVLTSRVGGARVFQLSLFFTNVFTVALPPVAQHLGFVPLVALRVATGLAEGALYSAMFDMLGRWCPPLERSRIFTIAGCGNSTGVILALPVSGILSASEWRWPSVFYFFGVLGFVYNIAFHFLGSDSPAKDRFISAKERHFIETAQLRGVPGDDEIGGAEDVVIAPVIAQGAVNLGEDEVDETTHLTKGLLTSAPPRGPVSGTPFMLLLTNVAFYVTTMAAVVNNWGGYTALTELPSYMKDVLKFNVRDSGVVSVVPYIAATVCMLGGAVVQDWLVQRGNNATSVRRSFICLGFLVTSGLFVAVGYASSPFAGVTLMTLALGANAVAQSAVLANIAEIFPGLSGFTMSLTNTAGTLPGIIAPVVTGAIVTSDLASQRRVVFFVSSAIYGVGAIVFGVFGSAKRQA